MEISQSSRDSIFLYAVQCARCYKWRLIPTKEEYEAIRESIIEDPYFCDQNPEDSCDNPTDIEYDGSLLWAMDKPNLPKTPANTQRKLDLRQDSSKFDVYYLMPNGEKVTSIVEVEEFLEAYPEYKDQISVSKFSFATPTIVDGENLTPVVSSYGEENEDN